MGTPFAISLLPPGPGVTQLLIHVVYQKSSPSRHRELRGAQGIQGVEETEGGFTRQWPRHLPIAHAEDTQVRQPSAALGALRTSPCPPPKSRADLSPAALTSDGSDRRFCLRWMSKLSRFHFGQSAFVKMASSQ